MRLNLKFDTVKVTPDDIAKALRRPPDFGYGGDNEEMFETWALGPVIRTRESGICDRSNARVLKRCLEAIPDIQDDYSIAKANHWAVGWVEHLSYRVVNADGSPSKIAKFLKAWFDMLEDYPIADEDDHSDLEQEVTWDWLVQECPRMADTLGFKLRKSVEESTSEIEHWWGDNMPNALESHDDQGASPAETEWLAAFEALGFEKESE